MQVILRNREIDNVYSKNIISKTCLVSFYTLKESARFPKKYFNE